MVFDTSVEVSCCPLIPSVGLPFEALKLLIVLSNHTGNIAQSAWLARRSLPCMLLVKKQNRMLVWEGFIWLSSVTSWTSWWLVLSSPLSLCLWRNLKKGLLKAVWENGELNGPVHLMTEENDMAPSLSQGFLLLPLLATVTRQDSAGNDMNEQVTDRGRREAIRHTPPRRTGQGYLWRDFRDIQHSTGDCHEVL